MKYLSETVGPPNGNPAPEMIADVRKPANAALIVRAVNAHADLVAALEKWSEFMQANYAPSDITWWHETLAALAKAKA